MTLYQVVITVPADTPDITPVVREVEVEGDYIVRVMVHFPPGCAGKVLTRLLYGEEQLFPRPAGTWLQGDGMTVDVTELIKLPSRRTVLTIEAKSPGSLYPHTITWSLVVLPASVALWWSVIERFIAILSRLFRVRLE